MLVEEEYIKSITSYLGFLSQYITSLSKVNLHDTSVMGENLCGRLMNLIYGYKLQNMNLIKKNAEVIDLYDKENGVSVQVTSNKKLTKVRSCLDSFIDKELYKEYKTLYVYILTTKQSSYHIKEYCKDEFYFNKNVHIIDKDDLISKVQGLDLPTQKEVLDLLKNNIKLPNHAVIPSNEVGTIINLVTIISDKVASSNFDQETEIDPEKKISKRFKDNAMLIENRYFNLCCEYSPVMAEVEGSDNYDSVKNSKVALYLKNKSTEMLLKNKFDALKALDELTTYVMNLFQSNQVEYNETAIDFFVLKHLTECNVFPLLISERNV